MEKCSSQASILMEKCLKGEKIQLYKSVGEFKGVINALNACQISIQ